MVGNVDGTAIPAALAKGARNLKALFTISGDFDLTGAKDWLSDEALRKLKEEMEAAARLDAKQKLSKWKAIRKAQQKKMRGIPCGLLELFGLATDELGQVHSLNRVFELDELRPLLQKLAYNQQKLGLGLVATHRLKTVDNMHYSISSRQDVTLTILMLPKLPKD